MSSTERTVQVLRPAAYCVIYDAVGRVLLTQWNRPDIVVNAPSWTLPGGGLDFGESPHDAAVREVYEETGFHVELMGDPKVESQHFARGELRADGEFQALRFFYRARIVDGTLGIVEVGGSTIDVGWFDAVDVARLPLTASAKRALAMFPFAEPITLDHVQLALPSGRENDARAYWVGLLGLVEVEKPSALAVRGGAHFEAGDVRIHVGVDANFVPATKSHPALRVEDIDRVATKLATAGFDVRWSDEIPGTRRFHTDDPFGNRIEFIQA